MFASFFYSCNTKNSAADSDISPDLIDNPASASGNAESNKAILTFKDTKHDFGEIIDGVKVSHAFKFTNTGESDLIISNCVPSCGCTVPEFPRTPIKPGKSDYIKVIFDSKGRAGKFDKLVSVYSNSIPNVQQIFISGKVIKK